MCPDPSLLVAYLDGTLFPRDAARIEEHLSGCERCAALLAAMRQEREAAARSPRRWAIPALVAAVAIAAIAAWMLRSGSNEAKSSEITSAQSQPVEPRPVAPTPAPSPPPVQPSTAVTRERERPAAVEKEKPAPPPKPAPKPKPVLKAKAAPPAPKPVPKPARAKVERTIVPRVQWRASDLVVERSTDGGMTWTTEYTSDRPIRATAFLNADIAWLVGENGLVLRRTKNGWFGASAPADGDLTAVRATSPSRATVTHQDGRVFTTENGGVTWSPSP